MFKLPDSREKLYDDQFHLVHEGTDVPIANQAYRITTSSGEKFEGVTDNDGYTERIMTLNQVALTIEIFENDDEHIIGGLDDIQEA